MVLDPTGVIARQVTQLGSQIDLSLNVGRIVAFDQDTQTCTVRSATPNIAFAEDAIRYRDHHNILIPALAYSSDHTWFVNLPNERLVDVQGNALGPTVLYVRNRGSDGGYVVAELPLGRSGALEEWDAIVGDALTRTASAINIGAGASRAIDGSVERIDWGAGDTEGFVRVVAEHGQIGSRLSVDAICYLRGGLLYPAYGSYEVKSGVYDLSINTDAPDVFFYLTGASGGERYGLDTSLYLDSDGVYRYDNLAAILSALDNLIVPNPNVVGQYRNPFLLYDSTVINAHLNSVDISATSSFFQLTGAAASETLLQRSTIRARSLFDESGPDSAMQTLAERRRSDGIPLALSPSPIVLQGGRLTLRNVFSSFPFVRLDVRDGIALRAKPLEAQEGVRLWQTDSADGNYGDDIDRLYRPLQRLESRDWLIPYSTSSVFRIRAMGFILGSWFRYYFDYDRGRIPPAAPGNPVKRVSQSDPNRLEALFDSVTGAVSYTLEFRAQDPDTREYGDWVSQNVPDTGIARYTVNIDDVLSNEVRLNMVEVRVQAVDANGFRGRWANAP